MRLESNIDEVIADVEGWINSIDQRIGRAFDPASWREAAVAVAQAALTARSAEMTPGERRLIPRFLAQIQVLASGDEPGGMNWTVEADVRDALAEVRRYRNRPATREIIRQWVATPPEQGGKQRGPEDAGLSDDQLAGRIIGIIFGKNRSPERDAAARALLLGRTGASEARGLMTILQFAEGAGQGPTGRMSMVDGQWVNEPSTLPIGADAVLPPETLDRWIQIVADAWEEALVTILPNRVEEELFS